MYQSSTNSTPTPMTAAKRQGMVFGLLNNKLPKGAIYSPGAIADLLIFGGRYGFTGESGRKIFRLIRTYNHRLNIEGDLYNAMEDVLLRDSDRAYHALRGEAAKVDNQITYDEFRFGDIFVDETHRYDEIMNKIKTILRHPSPWPVYIDTESYYDKLNHGEKLALISAFDVRTRTVFLFRTVEVTKNQLENIKWAINHIGRKIVTFGKEDSLLDADCEQSNIQPVANPSLKETVRMMLGMNLIKTETMSDWNAPRLRDDQAWYAAMDAVCLHYLNVGERVDWGSDQPHRNITPRYYDFDFDLGHYRLCK